VCEDSILSISISQLNFVLIPIQHSCTVLDQF